MSSATQDLRDRMIDVVLEFNGTPRHRLFEYPYTEEQSEALLKGAGDVVDQVLVLYGMEGLGPEEAPVDQPIYPLSNVEDKR